MNYSVVIPSFQRPKMLRRALESVSAQTLRAHAIFVIIDEEENLKKYEFLGEFTQSSNVFFTGGGFGGARSRNLGLDKVNTEYVFFLDDDDEWLPDKIEEQLALLDERPECVGVTCGRFVINEKKETINEVLIEEKMLNEWLMIRNLTGSFSFFGYRINSRTCNLRLEPKLPMAQDMEFYMALSRFGSVGVVNKPLAKYYEHTGPRITGSRSKALVAYSMILDKYRPILQFRDACWYRNLVSVCRAAMAENLIVYLWYVLVSIFWSALSVRSFTYSKRVMKQGLNLRKLSSLLRY